ncbi:hypothetical protein FRFR103141_06325 [Fructilactobacillus fructivorans]|uniref:hypothetical protein n=2 Tax=Fructilactobacillus fructivorans TaxID=1614 RepID=UPI00030E88AE|nr:hypothetical protein [Fructilactobacillus fructivorans]KRK58237.1 hypothetical protein FC73_GL000620 [Fructilactobacillus fructivorans]KRN12923.1 hypothetical protein IV37_GL000554 [Fructilactobacillus fructivorans]KRN40886.1 hypothetical protein IV51_GL001113 [Fructilactobacillus fructivorans]
MQIPSHVGEFYLKTNLTDFKRLFIMASLIIAVLNILKLNKRSTIDLTGMMFLISNYITIMGFKLKQKYNDKRIPTLICKIVDDIIILSFFITMMDTSFPYIPQNYWKNILIGVLILSASYYIIVSFFVMNNEEIKQLIDETTNKFAKEFDKQIKQVSQEIDDMGGWSEFVKTDVGRQWASAVKEASQPKSPRDHKKSKKRGK